MISTTLFSRRSADSSQHGFSLVEVLIGLILSGLLMSMVAMVIGQSVTNNEVVRASSGLSSQMFTLRRILHRDLQNIIKGTRIEVKDEGFGFSSLNNFLVDGGVEVEVFWDFSGNMIRRYENSGSLDYSNSFQLLRGLVSWKLELLDSSNGVWVSAAQYQNRAVSLQSVIKALRLNLVFEDNRNILLVERIPYVFE